ncbi:hypothetical protein [Glutamicibacter uratoxydans]|uniref:hypothetical protein n=1 Tax=Glutamicibacter uratoxydans TaxID=43667 RepID=UPI003D6FD022
MSLVSHQPDTPAAFSKSIGYVEWNDALAAAFFSADRSGELVYLDQDDEAFKKSYESLGFSSSEEAIKSLSEAVASKLCWLPSGRATFAEFDMLTKRWIYARKVARAKKEPVLAPPHIALLMVLSIAAEKMQTSGQGAMAGSGSYYAQLERTLEISTSESKRLRESFAVSSEAYWEALNVWLEDFAGSKGLPSAYALMHRYVGLPISQALIRNTERRNIDRFFEEQGFIAGSSMSHAEMFTALDVWLTISGSSANQGLRIIWSKTGNQDRVTELALAQFAAWEGPKVIGVTGQRVSKVARCILSWRNERKLLSSVAKFGLVVMQGVPEDRSGRILGEDGQESAVTFKPAGNNTYGVSFDDHQIESGSLVGSTVTITTSEEQQLRRSPKRIVIFTRDAMTASYVEVDRTVAGTESRILIKDDPRLIEDVEAIINDAADPSYRKISGGGKEGIPAGWVAYIDVTFLRAPNPTLVENQDFHAFQPRLTTQMNIQGGLRLPGRTRRWSAVAPMSLVVTSEEQNKVELYRIDRDPETLRTTDVLLHADLVPPLKLDIHKLSGGYQDFTVSLRRNSKTLQNMQIRLRDVDSEDAAEPDQLRSLAHAVGTALWPLTALEESDKAKGWIMGSIVDAPSYDDVESTEPVPNKISWSGPMSFGTGRTKLRLPEPGQESCIVTGSHRFSLPTFDGKYPKTPWMYSQCAECGISRRFPTRIKGAQKKEFSYNLVRNPLPKMSAKNSVPHIQALLDALMFLGEGSRKDFSMLARQIEDSALFERQLLMTLESLAFIEVERNELMEVIAWESVYQGIAGTDSGKWLLTGPWSDSLSGELAKAVAAQGASVENESARLASTVTFSGVTEANLAHTLEEYMDEEGIVPFSGYKLAQSLPPLSKIIEEIPQVDFPFASQYEYFVVDKAQWIESEYATIPGLYRLARVQGSGYFLRTKNDIENGKSRRVWAELGKHLAANILQRPLVSYDAKEQKLRVPLGAELPALYGRAAVLSSGRIPETENRINSITYSGISPRSAAIISRKIMS